MNTQACLETQGPKALVTSHICRLGLIIALATSCSNSC